jgi:hypothetical protein
MGEDTAAATGEDTAGVTAAVILAADSTGGLSITAVGLPTAAR